MGGGSFANGCDVARGWRRRAGQSLPGSKVHRVVTPIPRVALQPSQRGQSQPVEGEEQQAQGFGVVGVMASSVEVVEVERRARRGARRERRRF